jgi:hypothetical protein
VPATVKLCSADGQERLIGYFAFFHRSASFAIIAFTSFRTFFLAVNLRQSSNRSVQMSGAKSDCSWSPCSDDTLEVTDYSWSGSFFEQGTFGRRVCADSFRDLLLSPEAFAEGCAIADQSMRGSSSIQMAPERASVPRNNLSWQSYRPAAAAQGQHKTPDLLEAIVNGALQAASTPGVLSVSAAGPQRISPTSNSFSCSARVAANGMLEGPSLFDLQPPTSWQCGSQQQVEVWWTAST